MSKEIKDFIHLYLGCDLDTRSGIITLYGENISRAINLQWKPILRNLSDMTFEEKLEFPGYYCPEGFKWLLSKHFDLFGLIEAGLAIDKKTVI